MRFYNFSYYFLHFPTLSAHCLLPLTHKLVEKRRNFLEKSPLEMKVVGYLLASYFLADKFGSDEKGYGNSMEINNPTSVVMIKHPFRQ